MTSFAGRVGPAALLHNLPAAVRLPACGPVSLLGPAGAGLGAELRPRRLVARLVGGGKALGVCGAFLVGSRALREALPAAVDGREELAA